jgi:hypothetical protein
MADIDRLASRTADGIGFTLGRLASLILVVVVITAVVGVATFATGWWVFDGSTAWAVVGGLLCAVPFLASVTGWVLVRMTASSAPRLVDDVRTYLRGGSNGASGVLIDHDSGVALGMQARSLRAVKTDIQVRKRDLPALWVGVRAITSVPGLAAIAVLGTVLVGGLGTVLLIGGIID